MEVGLCGIFILIAVILAAIAVWQRNRSKKAVGGLVTIGVLILLLLGDLGFTGKTEVRVVECHKNLAALAATQLPCPY